METSTNAVPPVPLARLVGLLGEFTSGTSYRVLQCRVTGIEDFDAEMLTIDYVTHQGDKIIGAAIPASAFRPDEPNAIGEARADNATPPQGKTL